jgi:hypothetical protein
MEHDRADLTVQIPALKELLEAVKDLGRRLDKLRLDSRQNYYLKEACALKGLNYSTARAQPRLQPNGGKPDLIIAGRNAWTLQTVMAWLHQGDEDIQGERRN